MDRQNRSIINNLLTNWPRNTVSVSVWLEGGFCISFGWNSNGMGKNRGFEIVEILLVAHGGHHNDTIVTVEKRIK